MNNSQSHPVIKGIVNQLDTLTPKGKILGSYIIQNPHKAVFMTTRELSEACGVSEATVVRFVSQLGYSGYGEFLQALRDFVDSGLTLPDRADLPGMKGPGTDLLHRVVFEEMNNLRQFYEAIDMSVLDRIVEQLAVSCTSNTMDADCNCISNYCGFGHPSSMTVLLPQSEPLDFLWK